MNLYQSSKRIDQVRTYRGADVPNGQPGDMWFDTVSNTYKQCTSNSPLTWVDFGGGGSGGGVTAHAALTGLGADDHLQYLNIDRADARYLTSINSTQVSTALGFAPYSAANPAGYLSSINSAQITTALGFTPYNASNPSNFINQNQIITIGGDATGSGRTAITLTIPTFSTTTKGLVSASGGGTTNFLRADGTWAAPPAGEGGGSGGDSWTYVKLTSNASTTGTANTDTALTFVPAPNTQYEITGRFFLQAAATTTGVRPGIKWPTAGITQNAASMVSPLSATAAATRYWGDTSTQNAASTGIAVANQATYGEVQAMFITGTSVTGAFVITLASEVSGSAVQMNTGSFIRYRVID